MCGELAWDTHRAPRPGWRLGAGWEAAAWDKERESTLTSVLLLSELGSWRVAAGDEGLRSAGSSAGIRVARPYQALFTAVLLLAPATPSAAQL